MLAALVAFALGSIVATQIILANVAALGPEVGFGVRLQATGHDLLGLSTSYLPLIAVGFLLGLPIAAGIARLLPSRRMLLYILAGAVAVIAIHLLIKALLGLSAIAATRTVAGLLSQGLAGAVGGYLFYRLRSKQQTA
ncbi:MAG: hypothetical protein QNI86_01205 [Halieaceae bacterium]|nr:hypothetical protein [Halieaceae bacterium]